MIKRLKTIEQIKVDWGYNFVEDMYKDIRFYEDGLLDGHITFKMKKYFGSNVDVKEEVGHYDWYIKDADDGYKWRFKDEWFVNIELLEDRLFEI